jgi:hypothetical protein
MDDDMNFIGTAVIALQIVALLSLYKQSTSSMYYTIAATRHYKTSF